MNLFIVRHGETKLNAERRYLGYLDPELSETGIAQAHALIQAFPVTVDVVVCSPLRRARQTADIFCQAHALSAEIDSAFRERHVGVFEGLTQREAQDRFPELWSRNVTRQWHDAPTGGETIAEVFDRVSVGLNALQARFQNKNVALIAHGFVAKVTRAIALGQVNDFFDWQLANGSVCELNLLVTALTGFEHACP